MSAYVKDTVVKFAHKFCKSTHQPHKHTLPVYGRTIQHAKEEDKSPLLDKEGKIFLQQATETFLYCERSVDPTMLVALSVIASCQSAPTEDTMEKTLFFLDYAASHPDAILTYAASAIVLNIHSDASYLTQPKARSRAGGYWFMTTQKRNAKNNDAVLNIAKIIRNVATSAASAEIVGLFINTRQAIPVPRLLGEMSHKQPVTPTRTDNTITALGFVSKDLNPKATASEDMNY